MTPHGNAPSRFSMVGETEVPGAPRSLPGAPRLISPADEEWPPCLGELGPHAPPDELWVQGLPLDPAATAVAVVGTRRPTGAGREVAAAISTGLAEAGITVVSGLAVGIDAAAHRAALDAGGATIAVLGCGLDVGYPRPNLRLKHEIAARGTLVSEYPAGTAPQRFHFPLRNRIIAGLSVGVVVIEGTITSGALVTARLALDSNRTVYAVPGSTRNPMAAGPNELIRSGAILVTSAGHIFEDLAPSLLFSGPGASGAPQAGRRSTPPCDDAEQAILAALDDVPLAPDAFAPTTGLTPGALAVALSTLEVRGLVARLPGGYALTTAGARARSSPR